MTKASASLPSVAALELKRPLGMELAERWVFAELPAGCSIPSGRVPEPAALDALPNQAWRAMPAKLAGVAAFYYCLTPHTLWSLFRHATATVANYGVVHLYSASLYRDERGLAPGRVAVAWVAIRNASVRAVVTLQCSASCGPPGTIDVTLTTMAGRDYHRRVHLDRTGLTLGAVKGFALGAVKEFAEPQAVNKCEIQLILPNVTEEVPDDFVWCALLDWQELALGGHFDWGKALDSRAPQWQCSGCKLVKRRFHFEGGEWERARSAGEATCTRCSAALPLRLGVALEPRLLPVSCVQLFCACCGMKKVEDAFPVAESKQAEAGDVLPRCLECCRARQTMQCTLCGIVKPLGAFEPKMIVAPDADAACRSCQHKRAAAVESGAVQLTLTQLWKRR